MLKVGQALGQGNFGTVRLGQAPARPAHLAPDRTRLWLQAVNAQKGRVFQGSSSLWHCLRRTSSRRLARKPCSARTAHTWHLCARRPRDRQTAKAGGSTASALERRMSETATEGPQAQVSPRAAADQKRRAQLHATDSHPFTFAVVAFTFVSDEDSAEIMPLTY